jgi:hypothetical protein
MAGGHVHEQFLRRLEQSVVMNPGSVGLPYEMLPDGSNRNPPWAEHAVIGYDSSRLDVELRRVPVDLVVIRQSVLKAACPMPSGSPRSGDRALIREIRASQHVFTLPNNRR